MKNAWLIARRDFGTYLRTWSGYVIIAAVLLVSGLLFNAFAFGSVPRTPTDILRDYFYFMSGCTMVCGLFLSMRLLAEERQNGTAELLMSAPLRDWEIILGKYFSGLGMIGAFLLASLYMPILLWFQAPKLSLGHVLIGYIGLLLVGSASIAIGVLGSSLAKSQVVAAVLGGAILVALIVVWLLAQVSEPPLRTALTELAFYLRFERFRGGAIHLKDVVYYVLCTYAFLFVAVRVLESRRWK